jgi:serine/threonine protein phosphatase 1
VEIWAEKEADKTPPPADLSLTLHPITMRLFAIGDIHGCASALRCLDRELKFGDSDTVVTLGDYVDRGPDSRAVIEHLLELRSRCRLVTLRGNHEVMMLRARDDRSFLPKWLTYGGAEALDSYGAATFADIPDAHWDFIESTVFYHEEEQDFFVHANVVPDLPLMQQPEKTLLWAHFGVPRPHVSGRRMLCGHTAQKSGRPLNYGHAVCLDTYAYGGGWLTCLDVATNACWQASQEGALRQEMLGPPKSLE